MKRTLTFPGEACRMASVRLEVRKFLAETGFEEHLAEHLVLALDEACTNIIRHAHRGETKPVRMQITRLRDRVRFVLHDSGPPCDPAQIQGRPLDAIRPGGLGVHIIRQVFDLVEYTPLARGTKLTLEKKFQPEAGVEGL
jgi:anti-sigma regulatory factor (Ser/Thr protein kinase)